MKIDIWSIKKIAENLENGETEYTLANLYDEERVVSEEHLMNEQGTIVGLNKLTGKTKVQDTEGIVSYIKSKLKLSGVTNENVLDDRRIRMGVLRLEDFECSYNKQSSLLTITISDKIYGHSLGEYFNTLSIKIYSLHESIYRAVDPTSFKEDVKHIDVKLILDLDSYEFIVDTDVLFSDQTFHGLENFIKHSLDVFSTLSVNLNEVVFVNKDMFKDTKRIDNPGIFSIFTEVNIDFTELEFNPELVTFNMMDKCKSVKFPESFYKGKHNNLLCGIELSKEDFLHHQRNLDNTYKHRLIKVFDDDICDELYSREIMRWYNYGYADLGVYEDSCWFVEDFVNIASNNNLAFTPIKDITLKEVSLSELSAMSEEQLKVIKDVKTLYVDKITDIPQDIRYDKIVFTDDVIKSVSDKTIKDLKLITDGLLAENADSRIRIYAQTFEDTPDGFYAVYGNLITKNPNGKGLLYKEYYNDLVDLLHNITYGSANKELQDIVTIIRKGNLSSIYYTGKGILFANLSAIVLGKPNRVYGACEWLN